MDFLGSDLEGMGKLVEEPVYLRDWKVDNSDTVNYSDDKPKLRQPLRSRSCSTLYRSKSMPSTSSNPKLPVEFSTP